MAPCDIHLERLLDDCQTQKKNLEREKERKKRHTISTFDPAANGKVANTCGGLFAVFGLFFY
jgi:hypothetical protein